MFLPKSKYKGPFSATNGENQLLIKETLKPYTGKYIVTYKNQYFEGETPQTANRELILKSAYEKEQENKNKKSLPTQKHIVPKEADYKNKKYIRYFCKDKRSGRIIEINKSDFNDSKKLPSIIITSIEWWIEGPVENTKYNGYTYFGAKNRNLNAVEEAEKTMRGIKNYLKDLSQFVV